ncbi:unnamed protein product [Phaedon cochleariae]|uniref:Uncharacterized protein n=1 Tax=Phaedon cochleariae TaxID=80249 RepID=A0A9N9SID2_PHACE|nr:unnamed protein product [Phaedon cochleariae]
MTPLDCALQRGFRSTAKYLQLHGGVPASRLSDIRNKPTNSASNLRIRDDVTVLGGTTTDSERENGIAEKNMNRKKILSRFGRKGISVSSSELESAKLRSRKLHDDTQKQKQSLNVKKKISSIRRDTAESTRSSAHENIPSSSLDYTNEIIINGRTEINIRQTEEIILGGEKTNPDGVLQYKGGSIISATVIDRDRRPRSAKYSRLKKESSKSVDHSESVRDEVTSTDTIQQQGTQTPYWKDQSTNTSVETIETVIENKKGTSAVRTIAEEGSSLEEQTLMKNLNKIDQQSIISVTSEDAEELRKDLVVEVSVHALPKSREDQKTQQKSDERLISESEEKYSMGNEGEMKKISNSEYMEKTVGSDTLMMDNKPDETQSEKLSSQELKTSDTSIPKINGTGHDAIENWSCAISRNASAESLTNDMEISIHIEEKKCEMNINEENEENEVVIRPRGSDGEFDDAIHKAPTDDVKSYKMENENSTVEAECFQTIPEVEKVATGIECQLLGKSPNQTSSENHTDQESKSRKKDSEVTENTIMGDVQSTTANHSVFDKSTDALGGFGNRNSKESENIRLKKSYDLLEKSQTIEGKVRKGTGESSSSSDDNDTKKSHESFRILDEDEANLFDETRQRKYRYKKNVEEKSRFRSVGNKENDESDARYKIIGSKIPRPLFRSTLSKSDKHLDRMKINEDLGNRVPSLPNISDNKHFSREIIRCNSTAPQQYRKMSPNSESE